MIMRNISLCLELTPGHHEVFPSRDSSACHHRYHSVHLYAYTCTYIAFYLLKNSPDFLLEVEIDCLLKVKKPPQHLTLPFISVNSIHSQKTHGQLNKYCNDCMCNQRLYVVVACASVMANNCHWILLEGTINPYRNQYICTYQSVFLFCFILLIAAFYYTLQYFTLYYQCCN